MCRLRIKNEPGHKEFESRVREGVYMQTLEHGVFEGLISGDDYIPRIVGLRHITVDESRFPGAPYLSRYLDEESASDANYSCKDNIGSTSSEKLCVDDVDDVILDSVIDTTEHSEAPVNVIVTSAPPNIGTDRQNSSTEEGSEREAENIEQKTMTLSHSHVIFVALGVHPNAGTCLARPNLELRLPLVMNKS